MEADQPVNIGYDLFRGEVIQATCADAGIRVRLVRNEHPETGGLVALQPSYLLVRAEDAQRVQAVVERTYRPGSGSANE